jgi:hypothetical protein
LVVNRCACKPIVHSWRYHHCRSRRTQHGWLFIFLGSLVCTCDLPYLRAYHSERTSLGAP